jgi:hypothetical protein
MFISCSPSPLLNAKFLAFNIFLSSLHRFIFLALFTLNVTRSPLIGCQSVSGKSDNRVVSFEVSGQALSAIIFPSTDKIFTLSQLSVVRNSPQTMVKR